MHDMFFFCMLCVVEHLQFLFLACSPVITKPVWQSPVTRMAFLLSSFGWVCEAYQCPANAIFPQLELIQSLLRVWKRPSVCQLHSTAHWGRTGYYRTYLQLRGCLFLPPTPCHCRRKAPSRLALLSVKKASWGKILQPSASSCSLWSKRSMIKKKFSTKIHFFSTSI